MMRTRKAFDAANDTTLILERGRIPQLDGLRAIAVLLVFVFHTFPARLPGGYIGVDIFFVLSGYLITTILLIEWDQSGEISFRSFYWRRALRLMPALLVLLGCYLAVVPLIFGRSHLFAAASSLYVMNWVRAFDLGPEGFLGHTWSLAIEEQFYLVWPMSLVLLLRFGRSTLRSSICAAICLIFAWRLCLLKEGATVARTYNGFDTRADALLIGGLLACTPSLTLISAKCWPVAVSFLAVEALSIQFDNPGLPAGLFTITAVAAASVISALVAPEENFLQRALKFRPLVVLGEFSYGFYLWHYLFTLPLTQMHLRSFVIALIALPLTIAFSWTSFNFIEKPILRFKHSRYGLDPRNSMEELAIASSAGPHQQN